MLALDKSLAPPVRAMGNEATQSVIRVLVIEKAGKDQASLSDLNNLKECLQLKATSYLPKPIGFASFCMALANVFHLPAPYTQAA
jgi:hypothetical protein